MEGKGKEEKGRKRKRRECMGREIKEGKERAGAE